MKIFLTFIFIIIFNLILYLKKSFFYIYKKICLSKKFVYFYFIILLFLFLFIDKNQKFSLLDITKILQTLQNFRNAKFSL